MAKVKITKSNVAGKTWTGTCINPETGRSMTIHGGQAGKKVGKANPSQVKSYFARHSGDPVTPKKIINDKRWKNEAPIGSTVNVPNKFFKK